MNILFLEYIKNVIFGFFVIEDKHINLFLFYVCTQINPKLEVMDLKSSSPTVVDVFSFDSTSVSTFSLTLAVLNCLLPSISLKSM